MGRLFYCLRIPSRLPLVCAAAKFGCIFLLLIPCLCRNHSWPLPFGIPISAIYGRPNENSPHQFPPKNTKYHHKNTFFTPKRVQPII